MAVINSGFKGKLNEATFARIFDLTGIDATGPGNEYAVTQGTGRQVSIAAGRAFARGILSESDAPQLVNLSTPTNGQWMLIVRRIDWVARSSSIVAVPAATTSTTTPTAVPTVLPTINTNPGVLYDHVLAWVWVNSANTTLLVVDVRRVALSTARRGTAAQRTAAIPTPSSVAGRRWLQDENVSWFNTETGRVEHFFAEYDAALNPAGVNPAGWHTKEQGAVYYAIRTERGDGSLTFTANNRIFFRRRSAVQIKGTFVETAGDNAVAMRVQVPTSGIYAFSHYATIDTPGSNAWVYMNVELDGVEGVDFQLLGVTSGEKAKTPGFDSVDRRVIYRVINPTTAKFHSSLQSTADGSLRGAPGTMFIERLSLLV